MKDVSFEFVISNNVSDGLANFIKEHHVDLPGMMPHKHNWAEHIFTKSETKEMIFESSIPLLILPDA